MKKSIVWFKTDLRLHDNQALVEAIAHSDEIIPVYCLDDALFQPSAFGFLKTSSFRMQFLLESLRDLDQGLRELGSGLLLLRGNPVDEIAKLAVERNIQKVYAKKEVTFEEKEVEAALEKALWKSKCIMETFSTSTLYHAEDLPFSIKDIPDVFTSFRKKVEKEAHVRPVFEKPKYIHSPTIPAVVLPTLESLGFENVVVDDRAVLKFVGGETAGLQRLHYYFSESKLVSSYKDQRNGMVGGDYSSKFSAWLAFGCLSPREIYAELKKYEQQFGSNESTYWLIFELLWRDYFRFMMKKHRNQFFHQKGIKEAEVIQNKHDESALESWVSGNTGIDFIDANMLELNHTGFMSNRGRQVVASYFCNELKLDWRYGAAYFEEQLIDYDVCSNWGNWAYLAGVGNDPRGKRVFDIEKQAKTYDPKGEYVALWLRK